MYQWKKNHVECLKPEIPLAVAQKKKDDVSQNPYYQDMEKFAILVLWNYHGLEQADLFKSAMVFLGMT